MRSPEVPAGAKVIHTFAEYDQICQAFLQGQISTLLIIGRPGIGKTEIFRRNIDPDVATIFRGHITPFRFFCECFSQLGKLILLDDAEGLWGDRTGRRLIRALSEVSSTKRLAWATTSKLLEREQVPQAFDTQSRLCMICNRFTSGSNAETEAILDRAVTVSFNPTVQELYQWGATWFWDQEIFDYIGERLRFLAGISGRMLVTASQLKCSGIDWKPYVDEHALDISCLAVQELESSGMDAERKIQNFIERTGGSRATYYRIRSRLAATGQLDLGTFQPVKLVNDPPSTPSLIETVRMSQQRVADYRQGSVQLTKR
ncbi:MAG: hypothetical protein KDA90_22580 [Planctomycetaceae bacterium]|nr:hypothetical protein [Planctomycetaceae bacterium]